MKKFIIAGATALALAIPAAASADAPDGTYSVTERTNENASLIGYQSSAIKQNGQFVSGNGKANPLAIPDQTTYAGSRGDLVQDTLGH